MRGRYPWLPVTAGAMLPDGPVAETVAPETIAPIPTSRLAPLNMNTESASPLRTGLRNNGPAIVF